MSEQDFDTMAVVGHVADLVHAFKEATGYLKRIVNRSKTRPLPPGLVLDVRSMQNLEFSLTRGQDVIRSHYERDYRRLGQAYALGDHEAANQLKSNLSELHRMVVSGLRSACKDDQHVNFLILQDASDESQDRAIMSLMQLHQRVLRSGDLENLATGNPYAESKKPAGLRSRNPPRALSEEPAVDSQRQTMDRKASPQEHRFAPPPSRGPPTPELSPLQEQRTFMPPQHSPHSPLRRPKLPVIPIDHRQSPVPTLPTPPAEATLLALPGPPPTAPLPPAPVDRQRPKHREDLANMKLEAERRARALRQEAESGRSFLDRTYARPERHRDDSWEVDSDPVASFVFQEPHPGTPVDPSRVDEPRLAYSPVAPRPGISRDLDSFPMPGTSPRHAPAPATYRLVPPRYAHADQTLGSPPGAASNSGGNANPDRNSMNSASTYSSHASASSNLSRATNASSNASLHNAPPVPGLPRIIPSAKGKFASRVPEPIFESLSPAESQSTLSPTDSRRPSAPGHVHSNILTTVASYPPMPSIPAGDLNFPNTRRTSMISYQSGSSSASAMLPPIPIRMIPAQITDSSNSKLYMPTEGNKFGGLCKGAWRAQVGDYKKAYQAQQRPGGVATNRMVDFMKCKHCEFQGKVATDNKGKKTTDRTIITAKDTGLAYRWDFLFKSHLTMKNGSSADAEYGCMFCCAEGKGTPVFKSMAGFIAHTAEHRPGVAGNNNTYQLPDPMVCDRMEAIVGRIMNAEEQFEVALPVAEHQATPSSSNNSALSLHGANSRAVSQSSSRY